MLIQKSELKEIWKSLGKRKLEELKQEIIAILKKQEEKDYKKAIEQFSKEEKKYKYLEKSISGEWIEKAGYGIGTVRIWKGKKYKKIAPGKWARMYEKEGRGTNIAVGHLIAKVKKIDDIEELMNFVMQNKQRFQDENGMDLPILDKIRAEVDRQSGKIESKGNAGSKDKEYKLGDQLKLKNGKTVEYAGKGKDGKIRYTDRNGSKPITATMDESEVESIDNSKLSPKEKAENFVIDTLYNKKNTKTSEKQEETNIDKDFSKYSISELEKIKKDAMEKYKNAKTEEEEDAAIEIRNKANAQIRIHNYVKLPMKRVLNTIVSNEDKEKYLTERIKDTKINIQKLEESIKRTTKANNRNTKIDKLNELKENEKGFEQLLNELKEEGSKTEVKTDNKKLPSGYVNDLSIEKQGELLKLLKEHFKKEGMSGMEIADALDNAMDSKISDLEEIYNKNKEVKELLMNTDSDSSSFKLSDIYDRSVHDEMKQVQSFDEAKNVIKQIADNYGPTEKGRKLLENFMSYNVGGSSPIYDKVYEHFGISYNDLDADFDAAKNKILKLASGQKNVSKEDKKIQQGKDDFASRYRAAIEQEDKNFQKKENSKNIQNQMTPKQQKTFDDFEKKAIKNAGNTDRGKRFAKHNYNIDGEDWTITTDGRVMLCSREKFEEPTETDKITNMDKVFVIKGQKESAIPDGIDAIIKAAPKKVVVGKDYKGKDEKGNAIVKIGDRYFSVEHLKTIQNFLGPLSNAKMQVIPGDNKSRVKFESGNKAVVLLPIENGAELENRIINTNDIKKSLEDIIMFCNDFEDEDEVIEEVDNESLFSDYSAENPELFNSIAFKVEEVLNECGICGL